MTIYTCNKKCQFICLFVCLFVCLLIYLLSNKKTRKPLIEFELHWLV